MTFLLAFAFIGFVVRDVFIFKRFYRHPKDYLDHVFDTDFELRVFLLDIRPKLIEVSGRNLALFFELCLDRVVW